MNSLYFCPISSLAFAGPLLQLQYSFLFAITVRNYTNRRQLPAERVKYFIAEGLIVGLIY